MTTLKRAIVLAIAHFLCACEDPQPTKTIDPIARVTVFIPTDSFRREAVIDAIRRGYKPIRVEVQFDEVIIVFGENE